MTNDEIRMSKETRNPNDEWASAAQRTSRVGRCCRNAFLARTVEFHCTKAARQRRPTIERFMERPPVRRTTARFLVAPVQTCDTWRR
jgi:hypothetical protein